ncbi:hypothetical protein A2U01_0092638, partial [Trifolium medium]|nr:hypothetical protein [Trifolium medium]
MQESPRENGHLQRNLSVPNKIFCSIQGNRIMCRQELIGAANRVAVIK